MEVFFYDWQLITECMYSRYQVLMLGVCREALDQREVCINPLREEIRNTGLTEKEFYEKHNMCLVVADSKEAVIEMKVCVCVCVYLHCIVLYCIILYSLSILCIITLYPHTTTTLTTTTITVCLERSI